MCHVIAERGLCHSPLKDGRTYAEVQTGCCGAVEVSCYGIYETEKCAIEFTTESRGSDALLSRPFTCSSQFSPILSC
jgi:hypothetical protein